MKDIVRDKFELAQEQVPERPNPAEALEELVALVESGERHESVIIEAIETALDGISVEDWRYAVERDAKVARYFASLLGQAEYMQLPRKTQEDYDVWVDYWSRITDPRGWRRLHKRRTQATE
jgi:hypothetical protein